MRSYKHTFKIKVSLKMSVMQKAATMSESVVTQVPDIQSNQENVAYNLQEALHFVFWMQFSCHSCKQNDHCIIIKLLLQYNSMSPHR